MRRGLRGVVRVAVTLAVAGGAVAAGTAPAFANPPCGLVVTVNLTLAADMVCPGTALTVAADGVTVDLNGHQVSGSGVAC